LFWDSGDKRLPFSAVVEWDEILNKPTNLAYSTDISNLSTAISNNYLAKEGGTMTGPLSLSGGDGATAGKIILDQTKAAQITDKSTSTLFGFTTANTTNLTVGHGSFNLTFRGAGKRPTFNTNALALYSDIPTDFTTTTAATNAEKNAKDYADDLLADLKLSDSTAYFTSLTDNKNNSFTLNKSAADA
jgi:hypothetical protein